MLDDVKARFEDHDKRFEFIEKRHKDLKFYTTVPSVAATTLLTIMFGLFTFYATSNYKDDRAELREFERDMRVDLGRDESEPNLEILTANGLPISGQPVPAVVTQDQKGTRFLTMFWVIRNDGTGHSGPLWAKIYGNSPLQFAVQSIDEPEFRFEDWIGPAKFTPSDLPGGRFSTRYTLSVQVGGPVPNGTYPVLMKLYYGNGKMTPAKFDVQIIPSESALGRR